MNNQRMDRERKGRDTENDSDWDWYYYEYRYTPYSSDRLIDDQNREMNERENASKYNRNYDYNQNFDWRRGPYSGVGPRGYRRSDERIKEDVNERLTWHGGIDPSDIQVDVNDGIVTLKGSVNSRQEKRMAEDIADDVSGVTDVNNNLTISKNRQSASNRSGSGMQIGHQIREGMNVIGRDGETIGEVKEIRSNDFLVDRSLARDIYIPFSACRASGGQILLNIRADEIDDQGWSAPDLFDMDEVPETAPASKKGR